ncbi:MAG: hypothetical protein GF417_00680, partial [Candidatus Latescibacteria bacterium]|nr:hypothetical protein [bacterium]MBD3422941.1 hypothetical protein [Candidatus Latescibacterota bacterium]
MNNTLLKKYGSIIMMLALALQNGSCGVYSTTSRVAGDIKKIYIPTWRIT